MKILGEIHSCLMRRARPYCVLLPAGYEDSAKHYPVLYLLHGLFGRHDDWLLRTGIEGQAAGRELIVVMPEGEDGWYTDSESVPEDKFESHLLLELIPEVDGVYRTIRDKGARAIAGLSMGGYGAFKIAFKRPELFALAASFSGAFDAPGRSDKAPGFDWESLRDSVLKAFGGPGSGTRADNDLYKIVEELPAGAIPGLPFFHFDCGTEDGFLRANLRLKAALSARGIPHRFRELRGGHDWEYWGRRVRPLLSLACQKLAPAAGGREV